MSDSYSQYERACYVCGQRSEHLHWWSSRLPEYELDGKPSRNGRWDRDRDHEATENCPHCGYVSVRRDISIGDEETLRIVASPQYQAMRSNETLPAGARDALCAAILDDETERYATWGGRVLWEMRAAWACDEADEPGAAATCRGMAVKYLAASVEKGIRHYKRAGWDYVVIVDCLRRSADFDGANEWIGLAASESLHPRARLALEFEEELVAAMDTAAHMESELPGYDAWNA